MKVANLSREEFLKAFEDYLYNLLKDCEGVTGEAMRYAALDGGKRVRPLLVFLGAKAVGGDVKLCDILPLAAAIELVHSYSLVHDDMPEMDNDDMRRGKPSVHKQFGTATALLTGDGLLTLASAQMLEGDTLASREIAKAALDMVYGQSAEFEGCHTEKQWLQMYAQKTGALMRGAFRAGAISAGANNDQLANVTEFAESIGLAFQLCDDLLDSDKSVVDLIGKERTGKIISEQFDIAYKLAADFAYSDEILAFAKEMQFRKI